MRDWLTIECEIESDSRLQKFIQANPLLPSTMRKLLAMRLNLSNADLQKWVQEYQNGPSEYSQLYTSHMKVHFKVGLSKSDLMISCAKNCSLQQLFLYLHLSCLGEFNYMYEKDMDKILYWVS